MQSVAVRIFDRGLIRYLVTGVGHLGLENITIDHGHRGGYRGIGKYVCGAELSGHKLLV